MDRGPKIGDRVLSGRYTLLAQAKGSIGGATTFLGTKGRCRYCAETDPSCFKATAHAFPEALGNKWIISLDECDACNQLSSKYDDSLAKAVSPFLTLGGVKGKSNKIRQTGRSAGTSVISRRGGADGSAISITAGNADPAEHVSVTASRALRITTPVAGVPFTPRNAYKALVKMAIALLPDEELGDYRKLRTRLLDTGETLEFPNLEVGLSFSSIGNAPALAVGTLLRRSDPIDNVPHILFILSAGSVCFQIDLMSDHLEDHIKPVHAGAINIEWSNVIGDPNRSDAIELRYGKPVHLNWSSPKTQPQPIAAVLLSFDPQTNAGSLTPVFR